jgi:hypothetical protein
MSISLLARADEVIELRGMFVVGTNRTSHDVRCLVADGGKADAARKAQVGRN